MTAGAAGPIPGPAGSEDQPVGYWPTLRGMRALAAAELGEALAEARRVVAGHRGGRRARTAEHLALARLVQAIDGSVTDGEASR